MAIGFNLNRAPLLAQGLLARASVAGAVTRLEPDDIQDP